MKAIKLTALFSLIILQYTLAREPKECRCRESVAKLVARIEREYPGFHDKIVDTLLYSNYKQSVLEESLGISEACPELLSRYLGFFRDPHLFIQSHPPPRPTPEDTPVRSRKMEIDLEAFFKMIESTTDPLEGVWTSGGYKVGIVKEDDMYNAFIIESATPMWEPYEIKFTLFDNDSIVFYMQDHSPRRNTFTLSAHAMISIKGIGSWFLRQHPPHNLSEAKIESLVNQLQGFYCEPLSDHTMHMRISGFGANAEDIIEKMIEQNREMILSRNNLIIDLRNNGGGFSTAYRPLLPLIYTNPTRLPGVEFLVTRSMVDIFKSRLAAVAPSDHTDREKRLEMIIERFEPNIGKYMTMFESDQDIYINDSYIKADKPRQIAILINNGCASATEEFVFLARQSKKVKLIGTPTMGAIDYGSAMEFDFGCKGYTLIMPTFRSKRLPHFPLDNIGIQPDIYLDKSIADWIDFAIKYLENGVLF